MSLVSLRMRDAGSDPRPGQPPRRHPRARDRRRARVALALLVLAVPARWVHRGRHLLRAERLHHHHDPVEAARRGVARSTVARLRRTPGGTAVPRTGGPRRGGRRALRRRPGRPAEPPRGGAARPARARPGLGPLGVEAERQPLVAGPAPVRPDLVAGGGVVLLPALAARGARRRAAGASAHAPWRSPASRWRSRSTCSPSRSATSRSTSAPAPASPSCSPVPRWLSGHVPAGDGAAVAACHGRTGTGRRRHRRDHGLRAVSAQPALPARGRPGRGRRDAGAHPGGVRRPAGWVVRLLSHPWAAGLGRCSYSLYLWHLVPLLLLQTSGLALPTPVLGLLVVACTVVLTTLSYRFLERPFLHGRGAALSEAAAPRAPAAPSPDQQRTSVSG